MSEKKDKSSEGKRPTHDFTSLVKGSKPYEEGPSLQRTSVLFGALRKSTDPNSFLLVIPAQGLERIVEINSADVIKYETIRESPEGDRIVRVFLPFDADVRITSRMQASLAMHGMHSYKLIIDDPDTSPRFDIPTGPKDPEIDAQKQIVTDGETLPQDDEQNTIVEKPGDPSSDTNYFDDKPPSVDAIPPGQTDPTSDWHEERNLKPPYYDKVPYYDKDPYYEKAPYFDKGVPVYDKAPDEDKAPYADKDHYMDTHPSADDPVKHPVYDEATAPFIMSTPHLAPRWQSIARRQSARRRRYQPRYARGFRPRYPRRY